MRELVSYALHIKWIIQFEYTIKGIYLIVKLRPRIVLICQMKKVWSLVHLIHQTDLIIDYTCVYFQCVAPETFQEKIHLVNSSFIQRKQMSLFHGHFTKVTLLMSRDRGHFTEGA